MIEERYGAYEFGDSSEGDLIENRGMDVQQITTHLYKEGCYVSRVSVHVLFRTYEAIRRIQDRK